MVNDSSGRNTVKKIIGLLLVLLLVTPAFAADWSMFKNDISHSGYTADVVSPTPTLQWTKKLGFETDSSPVIVNDILYIGTNFGLHALDVKSGKELWTFHTNGFLKSVPAVSNEVVYFGADDRKFYALNARNGSLLWINDEAVSGYKASPAVVNNIVYIMPVDGSFYAFDTRNGGVIWSTLVGKISESSPAIGEGIITFGTDGGTILALDSSTGKEKWRYNAAVSDIKSSPVIADGTVFIGSNDGSVYAFAANNGALKWKYSTRDNVESSPSVKNGVVYAGSRDSSFFALDALTGSEKWKLQNLGPVVSSPVISNNFVYFGTRNNFIYGLDASTGKMLWKRSTGQNDKDYITSPAVSGNMLFAATHSGLLYAFSSESMAATAPAVNETETTATPEATPDVSPVVSTAVPSETEKSPGPGFSVLFLMIAAAFGVYRKKR